MNEMGLFGGSESEREKWKKTVRGQLKAMFTTITTTYMLNEEYKRKGTSLSPAEFQVFKRNVEFAAQQLTLRLNAASKNSSKAVYGISPDNEKGQEKSRELSSKMQLLSTSIGKDSKIQTIPQVAFYVMQAIHEAYVEQTSIPQSTQII